MKDEAKKIAEILRVQKEEDERKLRAYAAPASSTPVVSSVDCKRKVITILKRTNSCEEKASEQVDREEVSKVKSAGCRGGQPLPREVANVISAIELSEACERESQGVHFSTLSFREFDQGSIMTTGVQSGNPNELEDPAVDSEQEMEAFVTPILEQKKPQEATSTEWDFGQLFQHLRELSVRKTTLLLLSIWLFIMVSIGHCFNLFGQFSAYLIMLAAPLWGYTLFDIGRNWSGKARKRRRRRRGSQSLLEKSGLFDYLRTRPNVEQTNVRDFYEPRRASPNLGRHVSTTITPTANIYSADPLPGEVSAEYIKSNLTESRPYIPVTVNGLVEIDSLCDSGAAGSCISRGLYEELKQRSNTPLAFVESSLLMFSFLDDASSCDGLTCLTLKIGDVELKNVPFLIMPSTTCRLILGTSVIKRQRLVERWNGSKAYYVFDSRPESRPIPIKYQTKENHTLRTVQDIQLPPRGAAVANLTLSATPGAQTNLDRELMFVEKNNEIDLPVVIEEVTQVRPKSRISVTIRNSEST